MRYLALLLLAPWLLILGWAYWAYPKSLPRRPGRRLLDGVALLLAAIAAVQSALFAFDRTTVPAPDAYGHASGAIWQQVLPALCGYGAFAGVLLLALLLRYLIGARRD